MIASYLKNLNLGHFIMMCVGNIFLGLGVAVFKLSGLGNDPFTGMVMGMAEGIGMTYADFLLIVNGLIFIVQIVYARKLIGLGTVFNAVLLGYIAMFFYDIFINAQLQPQNFIYQLIILAIGIIIYSFGISCYQSSNMGVSPYDSLPLILSARFTKIKYPYYKIGLDTTCAILCFLVGGIVGLGMLAAMVCLGPVIYFFDTHFSKKLYKKIAAAYGKQAVDIK